MDLGRLDETQEPFVLASQVKQVFYATDPANSKWSIVIPGKRIILGIDDVDDEKDNDAFENILTFTYPENRVEDDVNMSKNYMRVDHIEGIHVVEDPKKRWKVNKL